MSSPEDYRRLGEIQNQANVDGITPNEFIAREIRGAKQRKNPFVNEEDPFIVLGFDGFDSSIFPVGSFQTAEEALEYATKKSNEEHLFSSDPESDIETKFQTYTIDGILVRPPEINPKP